MVWRQLCLSKQLNRFGFPQSQKSLLRINLSPICYVSDRFRHLNCITTSVEGLKESRGRFSQINPQIVQSTLANCPSDLVALSFFLWCARRRDYFHDRYAFSHMVDVLSRLIQRFGSIDRVVKELERVGCVTKPQTFLHLVRICWQGGMYALVFDALKTMEDYGYTINNNFAYNVVMDISFRSGMTDAALKVLRENSAPNFLSYNIALCNLCKLHDLPNIRVVLREMLRAGYYPNAETFLMILNCFCKGGKWVETLELLGLMAPLGIHTCVAVWNILIDGYCRLGRPDLGNCMLEKMIGVGCCPTVMTYTSLVKAFMECKQVAEAFRILSVMETRGCKIDLVLSNVLINCLSKLQMDEEALSIFHDLRTRKLEPDAYTLSSLVKALCSSGKFDLLPNLLSCFNCPVDLVFLNSLLSYFCKAGFPVAAVELFHDLADREFMVDKYSYAGLLTGLCRSGNFDKAVYLYHEMVIKAFKVDAHIHTLIISELIRAKKYQRALSLFREAVRKQYPLDSVSYIVAVRGLVRSGEVQEAYSLYNKMKGLGFNTDAHTANILLSGFCKGGDLKMVKQLLKEMYDSQVVLNYETFNKVFKATLRSRHYHSVCNLLLPMIDSGLLPEKAIDVLSRGLLHVISVDDMHNILLKESTGDKLHADTSGPKALIEFAA